MALEITDDLRAKLLVAKDADEVAAIIADAGQEATTEEIDRIVGELRYAAEHDGMGLSLDELDAVAGGGWIRYYHKDGCAATVEFGSDCWGEDGGCSIINNTYMSRPVDVKCTCGRYMFKDYIHVETGMGVLSCPYCKRKIEIDKAIWDALVTG